MKPIHSHPIKAWLLAAMLAVLALPALADMHAHDADEDAHDSTATRNHAESRIHWRKPPQDRDSHPTAWVRMQILGFNDFHGQLSSGRLVSGRPVGSAPVLASYLYRAQENGDDDATFIVHAGDHVGASPPVSALLQDEPSIEFLNLLANDKCSERKPRHPRCNLVGALGNHEFDEGVAEMLRLLKGGNHASGPFLEKRYRGARFPYVSANVVDADSGKPLLPPYVIKQARGQRVAFIGAVLKETPSIVTPTGVAGVRFLDEADAINRYVPEIKARGVHAIVVLIHQGTRATPFSDATRAQPQVLSGAIGDIVKRLDDEIDIVVSGHAHGFTNALVANNNGRPILVTQAFSAGTAYADIDIAIDPASHDIVEKSAAIVTTWADEGPGLMPDADVAQMVAQAEQRVAPLVNRVIGTAAIDILAASNDAGESALGNLIADAQRAALNTDFAFMNPGGIRADILAGVVTWGELFTVQPFNNDLVRMNLSGAQIVQLLNRQWQGQAFPRILKTSGLTYLWDNARPVGDRIVEVRDANGSLLNPAASYSVTVNSFLAAGGDNFSVLNAGTQRVVGPVDLDALVTYILARPQPFSAAVEGRIQRIN